MILVRKTIKIPYFMIFARKINKIPEFLHDFCSKNARIFHNNCLRNIFPMQQKSHLRRTYSYQQRENFLQLSKRTRSALSFKVYFVNMMQAYRICKCAKHLPLYPLSYNFGDDSQNSAKNHPVVSTQPATATHSHTATSEVFPFALMVFHYYDIIVSVPVA